MSSTRLAGHGMPFEGRALQDDPSFGGPYPVWGSPRSGRTCCECGAWSPVLPNAAARKRWHREHKAQQAPK